MLLAPELEDGLLRAAGLNAVIGELDPQLFQAGAVFDWHPLILQLHVEPSVFLFSGVAIPLPGIGTQAVEEHRLPVREVP